ncbi:capsule assembly Wzi family protein [Parapedomonas caeni]
MKQSPFHYGCRVALAAAMLLATVVPAANAAPWATAGDRQLRDDIELLQAYGVISGPVSSWPLPWAQIAAGLDGVDPGAVPPHARAALERIRIHLGLAEARTRYVIEASATNGAALVRDFADTAREDGDVAAHVEHEFGGTTIGYGVGWRSGQRGDDVHFEDAYLAHALGNWALYAGFVETWWGPGQESGLLFSNSSRPFPKIGFKRLSPDAFTWPVLNWLGPWRFEAFVGQLNENRTDYDNPLVAAMRLSFQPARQVEIGFSRMMQLCGEGRPCGLKIWRDALLPVGTRDNTGTLDEPGNQIAGVDLRIAGRLGPVATSLYGEVIGEDGDGIGIEQLSYTVGGTASGGLRDGSTWKAGVEYTDTYAFYLVEKPATDNNNRAEGSTYNNFIYSAGYTYRGRPIGFSLDGDSRLFSLTGSWTDPGNRRFYSAVRRASINVTNTARYRISRNAERLWIGEAGVQWPTEWGDVRVEARWQTDAPDTPGRSPAKAQLEIGWRTQF